MHSDIHKTLKSIGSLQVVSRAMHWGNALWASQFASFNVFGNDASATVEVK